MVEKISPREGLELGTARSAVPALISEIRKS